MAARYVNIYIPQPVCMFNMCICIFFIPEFSGNPITSNYIIIQFYLNGNLVFEGLFHSFIDPWGKLVSDFRNRMRFAESPMHYFF